MKQQNSLLPNAFSLVGTNHLPDIDNQGGIGSCASQAITYLQFSNAYSRYLHATGVEPTRCPKENIAHRFTPRYTFNYSGAGTVWVYDALRDHGCLTVDVCSFDKDEKGASRKVLDGKLCKQSAAWPVAPGEMRKALQNRVTGYEQIWVTKEPYCEKLTTTKEGLALLNKIKTSLVLGNAVVTGGYPARWVYGKVSATGTYGKEGDNVVVAAAGTAGGGHQVTIVGYDDDITAEFGGVTMKGAFIIANSYGKTWQNEGFVFMMYDAVNTVSQYEALNNPKLYSGPMYITPGKKLCMFSEYLSDGDQTFKFQKAGETELCGETYPIFDLYHSETQTYLAYSEDKSNRSISSAKEPSAQTKWVFIPYEKLSKWELFDEKEYKAEFEGSYWVYALNRGDESIGGQRFIDAGLGYSAMGRGIGFATLNSGKYPVAKSWTLDCEITDGFESKLGIAAGKTEQNEKVWALDQFCFTDWTTDVVRGMPALFCELTIETADRHGFGVVLTRTDINGKTERYLPAIFRYNDYHPKYTKDGETITFSGEINGTPEEGQIALSFSNLLTLPQGYDYSDYTWGFEIKVAEGKEVILKSAVLYSGVSETPLSKTCNAVTVKDTFTVSF